MSDEAPGPSDPTAIDDLPRTAVDPPAAPQAALPMAVDVRSMALAVLASLAVLAALHWASGFFIPLMLGLVFSYALSPPVEALARMKVPRPVGAAVLICVILGATAGAAWSLADDANQMIASLPQAASKVRDALHRHPNAPAAPLETVQKAAAELQKAAEEASAGQPATATRGVSRVIVEKPRFDLREYLWSGTLGLASVAGQIVIVSCLTYFLLVSGDTFRRKLVKIAGPGLAEKKLTVQALDEINSQMQRYLLVQLVTSVVVGLASWIAFASMGLNHAAVWGVASGVLNLVPYVGAVAVTGAVALAGFVQFDGPDMAFAIAGASTAIHLVNGYILVPWATSRASRMNAVAVFVGVLAWGWLWGVWGLLLGIPILMAVKAVCDRVEHLKPLGELLGT